MKTILTLAANPDDTSALQLNREIRDIETMLQQSKCRDEFTFVRRDAVRWDDLQRAIDADRAALERLPPTGRR